MSNNFVILDYETSGLSYWEPDFKVVSASLVWEDGTHDFLHGEDQIREALTELHKSQLPVLVFNLAFELGVTKCQFPTLSLNFAVDVARLVQCYDNGGDGEFQGFSLKKATRRILRSESNYEEEAHSWIRENVPEARRGKEGAFISRLPLDILTRYNVADSLNTLKLYKRIVAEFDKLEFDWRVDHDLYMSTTRLVVDAKIRGVLVERETLAKNLAEMQAEIIEIDQNFVNMFENEIMTIRESMRIKQQSKYKKKVLTENPPFNITSKKQLKALFVDFLGLDCGFKTPKGDPSFKSSHLGLYGAGGKLLEKRGKKMILINQAKSLLGLSEKDGRWHPSLKTVGTRTSRLAGGN